LQEINNIEFSAMIFGRPPIIKFNENSSYGNWVVPCERRDMKKLTVAYRIFWTLFRTSHGSGP